MCTLLSCAITAAHLFQGNFPRDVTKIPSSVAYKKAQPIFTSAALNLPKPMSHLGAAKVKWNTALVNSRPFDSAVARVLGRKFHGFEQRDFSVRRKVNQDDDVTRRQRISVVQSLTKQVFKNFSFVLLMPVSVEDLDTLNYCSQSDDSSAETHTCALLY